MECKALALWYVASHTLSQKKKKNDIVTLLGSFLWINTIIPPIHLNILDLSPHQLIQNLCIKELIY